MGRGSPCRIHFAGKGGGSLLLLAEDARVCSWHKCCIGGVETVVAAASSPGQFCGVVLGIVPRYLASNLVL